MAIESFTRRRVLLKQEVTEGTDALPVGATDGLLLLNGSSKVESTAIERVIDRDTFGHDPFLLSNFRGTIEGDIELIGNAAAGTAPSIATLLKIAGLAQTLDAVGPPAVARYNPISTLIPSGTAYFHHAGTLVKLTGCRAALSALTFGIGKAPTAKVQILGDATGDVDEAALPTVDLSGFQVPIPVTEPTWSLLINGFAVSATELTLDFGSDLKIIEHSEDKIALIAARKPTWSATFYRPAKASLDPFALAKSHASVSIVSALNGGSAGQLTRLTIGQGQIESVEPTDADGFLAYKINGRAIATSAGNDEFLLEFE